jgi:hypothetical protein
MTTDPQPLNARDQSAWDAGCICSRKMPYLDFSHERNCPLHVDPKPVPIPDHEAIMAAIVGLSEYTQRALLRTIWKDGIDIDAPTFDANKFAEWIARPYIERCAKAEAEVAALKAELAEPWKHSEHWRNPETGQVECECCCSWALDAEKDHREIARLTALCAEHMIKLASIGDECRRATAEDSTADEIEMQEILCRVSDAVFGMSFECSVASETPAARLASKEPE